MVLVKNLLAMIFCIALGIGVLVDVEDPNGWRVMLGCLVIMLLVAIAGYKLKEKE